MKADLYLFNSSFIDKDEISPDIFCDNLRELQKTILHINKINNQFPSEKDQVFRNNDIFYIKIFENVTIHDILFVKNEYFSKYRDEISILRKILINHAKQSDLTEEEIVFLLMNNSDALTGLLCFHSIDVDEIDDKLIIQTKEHWDNFHRYFLSKNPVDESNFYYESQKYFTNINFHPNVEPSLRGLEGGLKKFAKGIVYNLTQLNDNFSKYNNPSDRIRTLRKFSSICKVDASAEGDTRRRSSLTFDFIDENSNPISIYCEPHLKLGKNDLPGDTHFYFNRIYFHEGKPDVEGGRILVAHIGKHL
ncbi:MAG: hypothetical protein K8R25_15595 [Methanosarcinales archaeon]|nr:hypothetical protein [Methanosarcinales archaeon]